MTFAIPCYWPAPAAGKQIVAQFRNPSGGLSTLKRYVARGTVAGEPVIRLDEYGASGWLDAWEYRTISGAVEEVGTEQPSCHKVYKPGKTIPWGGLQAVGDVVARALEVDVAASDGIADGYWNFGHQKLEFEDFLTTFTNDGGLVFTDVVQTKVMQSWCIDAACQWQAGQAINRFRYWLAPGLGAVQIEYILPTPRIDYAAMISETREMA